MKKCALLFGLLFCTFLALAEAPKCPMAGAWSLAAEFSDEFEGGQLDAAKWMDFNPYFHGRAPGYFSRDNVAVSNGCLHLAARSIRPGELTPENDALGMNQFATATVRSRKRSGYGYYETRCRSMNAGVCNAFWLYDPLSPKEKHDFGNFSEEIDIVEMFGKPAKAEKKRAVFATVHRSLTPYAEALINARQTPLLDKQAKTKVEFDFAQDFHTYGFLWTPLEMRWFIDGKEVFHRANDYYKREMHVILDCEIMKEWDGVPNPADLPAEFTVDYVRVWRPAPATEAAEAKKLAAIAAVRPEPRQMAWQKLEFTTFFHFGVNTFTDKEWGDGTEKESIFNPAKLDCAQWVKAAKAAGAGLCILTAKHHDGFCLWPSAYTDHCVKNSPWRNGKGDVVAEFVKACRDNGVKAGVYLSPWDRHEKTYGTPAYNTYYCNQLTELLTHYGPIDEIWLDGACGEGPNGKRQDYDFDAFTAVCRKLQPQAVMAIAGPDIRWVGNEGGLARESEWSPVPNGVAQTGPDFARLANMLSADSWRWAPAECDTSIRPGWFYHATEDGAVKSLDTLIDTYFRSIGRNSVLLLNIPPNRDGLLAPGDTKRLEEFGAFIQKTVKTPLPAERSGLTLTFPAPTFFDVVQLGEDIEKSGQRVEAFHLEADTGSEWALVASGTTIGYKRLLRLNQPVRAFALRLCIDCTRAPAEILTFSAHRFTK